MKQFVLFIKSNQDDDHCVEKVWSDNDDEKVKFSAQDLNECPEDAIIGRSIFDGDDFIKAVELGFRIALKGYDEIVVKRVPWDE